MKDKPIKLGPEQIVHDFDEYLMKNIPRLLDEDSITVIKEISNEWRELRNNYFDFLLKQFDDIKKKYPPRV